MITRTKHENVTFQAAFRLAGVDGIHPPGTYEVAIEEELLEQLSFPAYHRISTTLRLPIPGGGAASYQAVAVAPEELEAAQRRDEAPRH